MQTELLRLARAQFLREVTAGTSGPGETVSDGHAENPAVLDFPVPPPPLPVGGASHRQSRTRPVPVTDSHRVRAVPPLVGGTVTEQDAEGDPKPHDRKVTVSDPQTVTEIPPDLNPGWS